MLVMWCGLRYVFDVMWVWSMMRVVAGRERRNRCESDERDREREREQGERVRLIGWEWMRMTVLLGCFRLFVRCVLCLCVLCCVLCVVCRTL